MLRTRLWMGSALILLVVAVLLVDQQLAPWYPFLFLLVLVLGVAACVVLLLLLGPERRPALGLALGGTAAFAVVNWLPHLDWLPIVIWPALTGTVTALVLAAFLIEMASFREPGQSVNRISLSIWL